jgi:hypothetical protein
MKDKSVAMPCESRGVASAWLIKHVIDAQAIKAMRCIVFPPEFKYIPKRYYSYHLQRHALSVELYFAALVSCLPGSTRSLASQVGDFATAPLAATSNQKAVVSRRGSKTTRVVEASADMTPDVSVTPGGR